MFVEGNVTAAQSLAESSGESQCDVLVIGGGPAGSTMAALLAAKGERVTLLEKDKHPRFHIGESLLPFNMPLFEQLGVMDEIKRIGMLKLGIELISPEHRKPVFLNFALGWDKNFSYAYQVRRSVFDHILLKNAAAKGANVIENCRVTAVEFPPEGGVVARAQREDGQSAIWRAKFLVDASGRDTFMASRMGIKHRDRRHNSAAIFGHFTGAQRLPGEAEGHITIFWFDEGWFWFIPLSDGTTSIGAVCSPEFMRSRKTDVTSFLMEVIAMCPRLSQRLKDATLTAPATATGNFSYRAERMTGKNFIMIGDAFAFIDPVFSTGVYLAMSGAFRGAETVRICLHQPEQAARALKRFEDETRRGVNTFSWYIYRMTRPAFRDLFMGPRNVFRIVEAILSLLSGDVFRPSPIHSRLLLFKALYYAKSVLAPKTSFVAWRRHKAIQRSA